MKIILPLICIFASILHMTAPLVSASECSPPCVHGQCSDEGICVCSHAWAGQACDDCSQYYFGPTCNYLCQMCDLHGTCIPGVAGGCECDPGWTGVQCSAFFCSPACVHGTCSGPDTCTCSQGWQGDLCDEAVCNPKCQNGVCFAPGMCDCNEGWSGEACEKCDSQHFGSECLSDCAVCDIHGTCHSGLTGSCSCDHGWQGLLCDNPVCQTPCSQDADCIAPGWCECRQGFSGDGYECRPLTQCSNLYDWTPCIMDGNDAAACFDEQCQYIAHGDSCEDPLPMEYNVVSLVHMGEMHSYAGIPESCVGEYILGRDIFMSVDLEKSGWYVLNASPRTGLDIALAVWLECSVNADKCIAGLNDGSMGEPETLLFEIDEPGALLVQIATIGDYSTQSRENYEVSLTITEHLFSDGDEEIEEDGDNYEIIYDGEVELPESVEEDGDLDWESEPEDFEHEDEFDTEYGFSGEIDATESSPEHQTEAEKEDSNKNNGADGDAVLEDSAGSCSSGRLSGANFSVLIMFFVFLAMSRRRNYAQG